MKKGGGKQKGAAFERAVCEDLSLWVSHGKRDDLFWRSAMSGGRATVKHKTGKANVTQGGDICAVDPAGHALVGPFAIECKFYRDLKLDTSFIRGYGPLIVFWREAVHMAKRQGKIPMLIAKQNGWPVLLVLNGKGAEELYLTDCEILKSVTNNRRRTLYVFNMEEVLATPFPL